MKYYKIINLSGDNKIDSEMLNKLHKSEHWQLINIYTINDTAKAVLIKDSSKLITD